MIFAFFVFLQSFSFSGIIQDDVSTTDKLRFSFKTVCQKMVSHEAPLIEVLSSGEIDCMGKKVEVAKFCEKELAQDPYYLRGYVDATSKEVICLSGKKVILKFQCVRLLERKFCESQAKVGCRELQLKLAKRLDLVHSSVTKNEKGIRELNCYFESLPVKENSGLFIEN